MYTIVNLSQDQTKQNKYISETLIEKIQEWREKWKKIILYINRRWEFTGIVCKHCQYLYKCPRCDTSLTVYSSKIIQCHTCWYTENIPLQCKKCRSVELEKIGVGIEQVEKSIAQFFPDSHIFRFDSDTLKTKSEQKWALEKLKNADIIIGTKMITTGFDLKNIWLIGVILLEQDIIFPRFDTEEKVFSTMKQLFWRAKRNNNTYEIVLQTFIPNNPMIQRITEWNYSDFLKHTLQERKFFWYPPYKEFVTLEYRHTNKETARLFMLKIYSLLQLQNFDDFEVFFSEIPRKKYNQYYFSLAIKWSSLQTRLQIIKKEIILNPSLTIEFA